MFKKTIAVSFIFSLAFLTSASLVLAQGGGGGGGGGGGIDIGGGGGGGGGANNSGKTSFQVLVPTAEMRTPLVEVKDLDSCILNIISNAGSILGGLMGGGGGGIDMGGALGTGCSWDSIAWFAAKVLLNVQFDGMKTMAQTGFFENTSFIDNPDLYYSQINNEVTTYFLDNDLQNANLLESVKGRARAGSISNQYSPFSQSISEGIDFPGGEAGYQTFLANGTCQTGNFWDCQEALMSPKNDDFSVQMRTGSALNKVQNEALYHTQAEVQAGNGYRDVKQDCVYGHYIGCTSVTPGSTIEGQTLEAVLSSHETLQDADELDEALAPAVTIAYEMIVNWLATMNLRDL
jgi:hypothetical protein